MSAAWPGPVLVAAQAARVARTNGRARSRRGRMSYWSLRPDAAARPSALAHLKAGSEHRREACGRQDPQRRHRFRGIAHEGGALGTSDEQAELVARSGRMESHVG